MAILKDFELKEVAVADLKEWEINPRLHTETGLANVKESIERFGMISFMMCDKDLTIIGGHARKKVLIELGVEKIRCWVSKKKISQKKFKTIALLSNRIYSVFNQGKTNEFHDPFDLLQYGFSAAELDFEDDGEFDDGEMDNTAGKEKSHKIIFSFDKEWQREEFELFIAGLKNKHKDIPTNGERFIHFLREAL